MSQGVVGIGECGAVRFFGGGELSLWGIGIVGLSGVAFKLGLFESHAVVCIGNDVVT